MIRFLARYRLFFYILALAWFGYELVRDAFLHTIRLGRHHTCHGLCALDHSLLDRILTYLLVPQALAGFLSILFAVLLLKRITKGAEGTH